jgi:hypothetical protein
MLSWQVITVTMSRAAKNSHGQYQLMKTLFCIALVALAGLVQVLIVWAWDQRGSNKDGETRFWKSKTWTRTWNSKSWIEAGVLPLWVLRAAWMLRLLYSFFPSQPQGFGSRISSIASQSCIRLPFKLCLWISRCMTLNVFASGGKYNNNNI